VSREGRERPSRKPKEDGTNFKAHSYMGKRFGSDQNCWERRFGKGERPLIEIVISGERRRGQNVVGNNKGDQRLRRVNLEREWGED